MEFVDESERVGQCYRCGSATTSARSRHLRTSSARSRQILTVRLRDSHQTGSMRWSGESAIGRGRSASADAAAHAAAIKERIGRIEKGETVPGGLGRPMRRADVIALLGWTKSDERHAQRLAEMDEDAFEEFLEECHKRARRRRESRIERGSQTAPMTPKELARRVMAERGLGQQSNPLTRGGAAR
jgi:hypothetical protein